MKTKLFLFCTLASLLNGTAQGQDGPSRSRSLGLSDPLPFGAFANVRIVDGANTAAWAGSELGAWINAADASLRNIPGEIWVTAPGVTASSPISISAKHVLRFIQGGIYSSSATITLAQGATIAGPPQGTNDGVNNGPVLLQEASGANLPAFVIVNGSQAAISGVNIDGNKIGNPSGGYGVQVNGRWFYMENASIRNSETYGIWFNSTVSAKNEAAAPTLNNVMLIGNGQSGLLCNNTTDGVIDGGTQSENEGRDGYELHNCSGWRFGVADSGGNARYGLSADGRSDFWGGSGLIVGGAMQFGNNLQGDIFIQGLCTNAARLCAQWNKISYYSNGLSGTATDATYDSLHIENGSGNIIGPVLIRSVRSHRYKFGIHLLDSGGQASTENELGLFKCNDAGASSACIQDDSAAKGLKQQLWSPYLANNVPLQSLDASGTVVNLFKVGVDNNVYITGHPKQKTILLQATPGTSGLTLGASTNSGLNIPVVTSFTTTAATTDTVTITGMTSKGHCTLQPTSAGAAEGIASVFVSAKATNQITVTHGATAGWTFDIFCTPN
jgi:hypothetical protein